MWNNWVMGSCAMSTGSMITGTMRIAIYDKSDLSNIVVIDEALHRFNAVKK